MTSLVPAAHLALDEILRRDDPDVVGVVLTGSAARGMATDRSDIDVYVVYAVEAVPARQVRRTPQVDEIPVTLAELERPGAFGTDAWWSRWSFAWAQVLRDDTEARVTDAVSRQATLTADEQQSILLDRLDGYINYVYRALKADRDGRRPERRLDAAESVPWLLDVIFTLSGRVRPYNKYLPWELREHPLGVPEWTADSLLPLLEALLDGDPGALRSAYAVVERQCLAYDARQGGTRCRDLLAGWGTELQLLKT